MTEKTQCPAKIFYVLRKYGWEDFQKQTEELIALEKERLAELKAIIDTEAKEIIEHEFGESL